MSKTELLHAIHPIRNAITGERSTYCNLSGVIDGRSLPNVLNSTDALFVKGKRVHLAKDDEFITCQKCKNAPRIFLNVKRFNLPPTSSASVVSDNYTRIGHKIFRNGLPFVRIEREDKLTKPSEHFRFLDSMVMLLNGAAKLHAKR